MFKKIFVLVLLIIILSTSLFFGFKALYYSDVVIEIEGEHNPLSAVLTVSGNKLYPSGEGGKTYKTRLSYGEKTVELNGPNIKSISLSEDLASEKSIVLKSESVEAAEKAKTLVTVGPDEILGASFYFGAAKDWLTTIVVPNDTDLSNTYYVYNYSIDSREWKLMSSGEKISSVQFSTHNPPIELTNYINEEAGD